MIPGMRTTIATPLLALLALCGALVAGQPPALAQPAPPSVTIAPAISGNLAVRAGQRIDLAGTAPAGAAIDDIRLVGRNADGSLSQQAIAASVRNRPPTATSDGVVNSGGTIDGLLTLGPPFPGTCNPRTETCSAGPREVYVELVVGGQSATSNATPYDHIRPLLERYDHVVVDGQRFVAAVFDEPVRLPDGIPDSTVDWTISDPDALVATVSTPETPDCEDPPYPSATVGCTRRLHYQPDLGEDAEPTVRYANGANREAYVDLAGNTLGNTDQNAGPAIDNIKPALPTIEEVDGRAVGSAPILGRANPVVLEVGNLTAGHTLRITGGATAVELEVDDASPPATTSTMTVEVPLPTAAPANQRTYELRALAIDANGNTSDDTGKSPPRGGGPATAQYTLDTIAPRAVSAAHGEANDQVVVQLTEAIVPAGDQGEWRVDGVDVTASGDGVTRTLTAAGPVPDGAAVTWQPVGGTYTDAAGNELVRFEADPLRVLPAPPLSAPVVTNPGAPVLTNQRDVAIGGTAAPPANVVDVFRGDALLATVSVTDGSWSYTAQGLPDGEHQFEVRSRAPSGGISGRVAVPRITVDGTPPEIDATEPAPVPNTLPLQDDRERVGTGGQVTVAWIAEDARFQRVVVAAAYGGAAPIVVGTSSDPDGSLDVTLPEVTAETVAVFTVTASDAAGNSAADDAHPVVIDPTIIGVRAALTRNAPLDAVVGLTYARDLAGNALAADFRASDGLSEEPRDRIPLGASRDARTVTLTFAQAFPGPEGDRNARPWVAHVSNLGGLRGTDGARVDRREVRAADLIPPVATTVAVPPSGPTNVPGDRLTLTGATDESFEPNTVVVTLEANGQRVVGAPVRALPDGTFSVPVDLAPNAVNTLLVDVTDPSGNPAPETVQVVVIEDSRAPTATRLLATLEGADRVTLRWAFDEAVIRALFEYRSGSGPWQQLADTSPNAAEGQLSWPVPDGVNPAAGLTFRLTGTDLAGNVGDPPTVVGLTNLPRITDAVADGLSAVVVTTSEPVTTDAAAPAGFAVQGGPGVRATAVDGSRVVLTLNAPLPGGSSTLTYTGEGGWSSADGRPLQEGSVPIRVPDGFLFPVTGLAAGPTASGGVNLSWVDERNDAADVDRYELARDGTVVGSAGPDARLHVDPDVPSGSRTYTVTVVGTDGSRSEPVTVTLSVGPGPEGGTGGGTGAPPGSTVLQDCPFPAAPNITSAGGTMLSCDGLVAVLVPPGAASDDLYGKVVRRSTGPVPGFGVITDLYQLVVIRGDGGAALDAFGGYVEVSFRHGRGVWDASTRERLAAHRARADGALDELAPRVTPDTVAVHVLTAGSFGVAQADGATVRAFGPDPAVTPDRFATAAALAQTQLAQAGAAVIARADDYPDALASAPLAAMLGGPVLLARTGDVPMTTLLELQRLGVQDVVLVGGEAALGPAVAGQLEAAGYDVSRVAGPTRFETAAEVAGRVGSLDGTAYLATGAGFADALAASAPAAALARPVLLAQRDDATQVTLGALAGLGVTDVHVVGGNAAIGEPVAQALAAAGYNVSRSAGPTRVETAIALAEGLVAAGALQEVRPALASADGDGVTSPDALAAGPIAGRAGAPLLLAPRDTLPESLAGHLAAASALRGILLAGGPAAVTESTRAAVDTAAG